MSSADPSSDWNAPAEEWGNWVDEERASLQKSQEPIPDDRSAMCKIELRSDCKKIALSCLGQLWVEAEENGANRALGFPAWKE